MFRFLFKRSAKAAPPVSETRKSQPNDHPSADASALAAEKAAALARASDFGENEAAAAEFVLMCRFADARLQAAQHVRSKTLLESLAQAMRETDRRVAKLAQQRLDAIKQKERFEHEAADCLARIELLAKEPVILPNHLAEIDRSWDTLRDVPQELAQRFELIRSALHERLLEQTALQRALIELRNGVQKIAATLEHASPADSSADAPGSQLDMLAAQFSTHCSSSKALSLPKHLLTEIETSFAHARRLLERLARRQGAIAAHEHAYCAWEGDPDAISSAADLQRALRSLPVLDAEDAALFEQRLERLRARSTKSTGSSHTEAIKPDMERCRQLLESLERALDEGALQLAAEHDKELRGAENHALHWNEGEAGRLAKARAELSRLKDWARWGGKVSREELIKAAEDLAANEQNPSELAKKIGSLRSQWKSMDTMSGSANREAWMRFDAACTTAYAPVAAYFGALAAERKVNQERAQLLIVQLREIVATELNSFADEAVDWKKVAALRSRMMHAWRDVGQIDRKAKKELDKQFFTEMAALAAPLTDALQEEAKRREYLIAEAAQLDPADKKSMAALRRLQQQWQRQAKLLPLERKEEQALWLRFRSACDDFIARRNQEADQAGMQHQENSLRKIALCEKLESETGGTAQELERLLTEAAQQWSAIGPVVREHAQSLETRYRQAVAALRSRLDEERQAARRLEFDLINQKLALCMAAEEVVVNGPEGADGPENGRMQNDGSALEEAWRSCGSLPGGLERVLHARFQNALQAARSDRAHYAALLSQNCAEFARNLLRLEINLGIESPPELTAERLKLQVDALQASLKSGSRASGRDAMLQKLCELPALPDRASRARIHAVFDRIGRSDD